MSSLQQAGKLPQRVFLPHRSDPPYAHPNHGYTAASLSLSLSHTQIHTHTIICMYSDDYIQAQKRVCWLRAYSSSHFSPSAHQLGTQSSSSLSIFQLDPLNLTFFVRHPSLRPPPLHPSHTVFFARSLLQRGRQLTESKEEKTCFPPRETPVKNTHPAENTCWHSSCISQWLLFLSRFQPVIRAVK